MIPRRGFALIELMVIVAILSVSAAFFVPRYLRVQLQKKQQECITNLLAFRPIAEEYYKKNGVYPPDLLGTGWTPIPAGSYEYIYEPSNGPHIGFILICRGNIDRDPALDEARMDETGRITRLHDDRNE